MAVYKLGDVATIKMCKRVMLKDTNNNYGVPFYTIGTLGGKADRYISEDLWENLSKNYNYPRKGDALISASGTIGKVVLFDGKKSYFQDSNIIWIESDIIESYYLYLWLLKKPFLATHGSTIKRLYNSNISATKIRIPSIKTQKEIIEIIKPIENLFLKYPNIIRIDILENTKKDIQNLIEIIKPLEDSINNIKSQIERIKEILKSKYELVNTHIVYLKDFIEIYSERFNGQDKYLATNAIGEFSINLGKVQDIFKERPSRADLTPALNSIIISKLDGENKVLFIDENFKYVVSTGFFNFKTENLDHIVGFLLSEDFKKQKSMFSTGTTMVGLNNDGLNNIKISKPLSDDDALTKTLNHLIQTESKLSIQKDKLINLLIK